eukprot:CAMPEP_0204339574 /NCGR_PEP_ID=MMETSP0469-20131031/21911_1 /ASSEMBLY_ACC=CAM_ASM_000384 /TAXON_ID=2969 /ORGANISM="Oxyrrhis marina" /LENGTH=64 /DNA_ID=CAMNT_0051323943 /DNA_START=42 /DNA_END=236 /DNA_ORIENTATION=-
MHILLPPVHRCIATEAIEQIEVQGRQVDLGSAKPVRCRDHDATGLHRGPQLRRARGLTSKLNAV